MQLIILYDYRLNNLNVYSIEGFGKSTLAKSRNINFS